MQKDPFWSAGNTSGMGGTAFSQPPLWASLALAPA